jgi:hypothetical protein
LGILEILHKDEMALGHWSNLHYWCSGSELGHHQNSKYHLGIEIESIKHYLGTEIK